MSRTLSVFGKIRLCINSDQKNCYCWISSLCEHFIKQCYIRSCCAHYLKMKHWKTISVNWNSWEKTVGRCIKFTFVYAIKVTSKNGTLTYLGFWLRSSINAIIFWLATSRRYQFSSHVALKISKLWWKPDNINFKTNWNYSREDFTCSHIWCPLNAYANDWIITVKM